MANSSNKRPADNAERAPETTVQDNEPLTRQDPAIIETQTAAPEGLDTSSGKFVQHLPHNLFGARVISEDDWKSIGVYDQASVEWNEANGFRLPVEMFNDGALQYLTNRDDGFRVVGG
ncbi:hypothetical protein BI084_gp17 [Gordonia phage Terapin]|uniref:Uncharacterized protein n=5 Tax=Terapinvirus terapin TaxID=2734283 RepID=A0A345MB57_9CAUD|nr:hypothetical protein BI084_gp17 [Gordonia phage Terapin]AVP43294.1 hypothetical protein PBI_DJOKOVIC_17 [Gordonia phage Djokovic]AXH67728.1 hypothetical protein SEA_BEYONCAGE_17 [Gordonia phage Beyoncage]QOC56162.1 hypothetical protein SEA_SIENNA_17 [Gordonia phage Sienna]QOC56587.1 hypothetical protein SEA_BITESIZE_17 [Gordonia phage BiteSize]QYW00820.1 hypothetical protein SEA_MADI_17 [Gordonia phage Madi]